jgi:hypothetical protein
MNTVEGVQTNFVAMVFEWVEILAANYYQIGSHI